MNRNFFGWLGILTAVVCGMDPGSVRAADPEWDKAAATTYLDTRMKAWLDWSHADRGGDTKCISCHTAVPMALARPSLGEASEAEKKMLANVKARITAWDKIVAWNGQEGAIRPFYPGSNKKRSLATESVLNALVLVNHDEKRNKGILSDTTKKALESMWSTQAAEGFWEWLDFGLRPWELEAEYYGAALAAVAIGKAGKSYSEMALSPEQKKQLAKLREYLKTKHAKQSLHNRLAALWASSYLPDLLSADQQKALIKETLAVEADGDAWSLAALAQTEPGDATRWEPIHMLPDANTKFDGYATAFVVYVLKRAKAPGDAGKLAKATTWLSKNQVAQGAGPVMYLNTKRDPSSSNARTAMVGKFMRDAAAAYAVLALAGE